ncbi:MAG: hypothetical protein V7606_2695 [Burkholderiales bacterium]
MLLAIATLSTAAQGSHDMANERGVWLTESGNLEVEIAPCGKALYGTVVRVIAHRAMSSPSNASAPKPGVQPLLGMKILYDLMPIREHEWQGRIYNRDNGETYDCIMTLDGSDQLKIRGYKLLPMFGKTQVWQRVSENPTR